jgi:hypothetical protein
MTDTEKVKKRIADQEVAILQARLKQNEAQAIGAQTEPVLEAALARRGELEAALARTQIEALNEKAIKEPENVRVIEAQKLAIIEEANNRKKTLENELMELRLRNADQEVNAARYSADGMAAAMKRGSLQAKADLKDMGKRGDAVFKDFNKNFTDSVTTWATTSAHGADIIKGFFFNMLGDRAQAEGKLLIASSIWPPNPIGLAAGAGLLGLGAFLKSKAGGAGSSDMSGGSSGGGGGASAAGGVADGGTTVAREEQKKKSVTVQVMGNYFETEQTKTRLMEIIRESTDATDFKYVQIGQN